MPYKKQDEPVYWRDRVEDLGHLPGDAAFDKNAAWEKLHNRLQQKPGRKKVMWYWMAAACLSVGVTTGVIFLIKEQTVTAKIDQDKTDTIPLAKNKIIKEETATAETVASNSQKKETKETAIYMVDKSTNYSSKQSIDTAYKISDKEIITTNNNTQEVPLPEIPIIASLSSDTSLSAITAIASPKKKLKVVHINELGNPPADEVIMARNRDMIFPQTLLSKHTVAYTELFPQEYPKKNILSIKLNPKK